jgi:SPP1 gp7 family putative phage head morphogenesis protein
MKYFKPQHVRPVYWEGINKQLQTLLYTILYKPIVSTIKAQTGQNTRLNARAAGLLEAIKTGKVQYGMDKDGRGVFTGTFNAAIGKEIRALGATFDERSGYYHIDPSQVPADIKSMASLAESKARELHDNIRYALDNTETMLDQLITDADINVDPMIRLVGMDFHKGLEGIAVKPPELSEYGQIQLETDYTSNMKLYIKKWCEDHIVDLRETVERSAREGYRFDNMIGLIRDAYGVNQRKAEFLARQETALFTAKYRKERLGDIGVRQYKWSARSSKLTRPDHWALNGKIFSYDNPPIVDRSTGRRGNPGEDFNCLCADIPFLGRAEVAA